MRMITPIFLVAIFAGSASAFADTLISDLVKTATHDGGDYYVLAAPLPMKMLQSLNLGPQETVNFADGARYCDQLDSACDVAHFETKTYPKGLTCQLVQKSVCPLTTLHVVPATADIHFSSVYVTTFTYLFEGEDTADGSQYEFACMDMSQAADGSWNRGRMTVESIAAALDAKTIAFGVEPVAQESVACRLVNYPDFAGGPTPQPVATSVPVPTAPDAAMTAPASPKKESRLKKIFHKLFPGSKPPAKN